MGLMAATIQLPENLAGRLEDLAKEENVSVDILVSRLVSEHLERRQRPQTDRAPVSFKPLSKEETGEIRSLTGAEIDEIFASEDYLS
jgi:hypothetical protein